LATHDVSGASDVQNVLQITPMITTTERNKYFIVSVMHSIKSKLVNTMPTLNIGYSGAKCWRFRRKASHVGAQQHIHSSKNSAAG
jgi:hypothetical protein